MLKSALAGRKYSTLNSDQEAQAHMLSEDDLVFDPESGEVRLHNRAGSQLLMRLTGQGIAVWCKQERREHVIPWELVRRWVYVDMATALEPARSKFILQPHIK